MGDATWNRVIRFWFDLICFVWDLTSFCSNGNGYIGRGNKRQESKVDEPD